MCWGGGVEIKLQSFCILNWVRIGAASSPARFTPLHIGKSSGGQQELMLCHGEKQQSN